MSTTRRLVLLALVVFVGYTLYHAVTPWDWTGQLQTPPPIQSVSYTCGPPWGSAYVHGPRRTAAPLTSTPCGPRTTYQVMTAVDVLCGVFGIALVAGWRRVRRAPTPT